MVKLRFAVDFFTFFWYQLMQRFPTWGTREIPRGTPSFHHFKIYAKIFNENVINGFSQLTRGTRVFFFLLGGTRAEKGWQPLN